MERQQFCDYRDQTGNKTRVVTRQVELRSFDFANLPLYEPLMLIAYGLYTVHTNRNNNLNTLNAYISKLIAHAL